MADKRVIKTKRNLKRSMIELLKTVPFEKITVSEICRLAETSRITFYTYYADKYALTEEMFSDYEHEAVEDYFRLQKENNPQKDGLLGYYNLLECMVNLYFNNMDFFSNALPSKNPYLYSSFCERIFKNSVKYIEHHNSRIRAKYSSYQTAAFICTGLWGVINESYVLMTTKEQIRSDVLEIYKDILNSDLFIKVNPTEQKQEQ